jgi:pimeloyl-ACP methyl ester carboxylesterase
LWHGGWVWAGVQERLAAAGVQSIAVDLPLTSLADDVAATGAALAGFGRPAVLVGHSYGGAVITAAGRYSPVQHLVYLAAFQIDEGESVNRVLPERALPTTRLADALRVDDDLVWLDPVLGGELMYHDAPPEVTEAAMARVRPVQRRVFRDVPAAVAWRTKPSTYAVSALDRVVHPDLQRAMAERAGTALEWPCGHSSPIVRPDEVAALIAETVRLSAAQSG